MLSWRWRRGLILLYSTWVVLQEKCQGSGNTERKGGFKGKTDHSHKESDGQHLAACGRAAWAAVWIAKVWQILCSALIWLSQPAFSVFGNPSCTWAKMPFMTQCVAQDYRAGFLFSFPPHFVYVLQGRGLLMSDGSLHHIRCRLHGMPLCGNLCSYAGIYGLSLVLWDTYTSPSLPVWDPLKAYRLFMRFSFVFQIFFRWSTSKVFMEFVTLLPLSPVSVFWP